MNNLNIDRIKECVQIIEQCLQGVQPMSFDQCTRIVAEEMPDTDRLEIFFILSRLKDYCPLQSFSVSQLKAIVRLWLRAYTNGVIDGQRLARTDNSQTKRKARASK